MYNFISSRIALILGVALALAGCAKEPPQCSDPATLSILRGIAAKQIGVEGGGNEDGKRIRFDFPRASAYDQKVKKLTCEAKLIVGDRMEISVKYESQLDDQNAHVVSMEGLSFMDRIALKGAYQLSGASSTPTAPPAASTAVNPVGTWRGNLEGEGEMRVTGSAGAYDVAVSVRTESGCGGSIQGRGTLIGDQIMLLKTDGDQSCKLTIKFSTNAAELEEDGCSFFHGAACGFSGTLVKAQ